MDADVVLWEHQKRAIEAARKLPYLGIFHQTGTGKSCTAINILRERYTEAGKLLKTIVIVPPNILYQFKEEFGKFSKIPQECITILYGHNSKRVKEVEDRINQPHIFITNYESLLMEKLFQKIVEWRPDIVVADELHRVKRYTTKRTKALIKLGGYAKFRYGLTGTPILNSIEDIFSQALFLDQGKAFGTNYFVFRAKYMEDKNRSMPKQRYFPNWQPIRGAEEKINAILKTFTVTAKKEDCLDLPPLVEVDHKVDMGPEQRKIYNEMKEDFLTFMDGKEIVATMALTKLLRLQQMASGFCRTFSGEDLEIKDSPKAESLKELLQDITPMHKCIVWAAWVSNYATIRRVCEELKVGYCELHGGVPVTKRDEIANRFRTDPSIRVVIANAAATSEGINLVEASYSIVYSRTFSLKDELQSIARNFRGGSNIHEKITRINLITRDTVDEDIQNALKKKEKISIKVLGDIASKMKLCG